jgi:hypothetical protein
MHRIVPVAELFAHIVNQQKLCRVLADADRLNDFFDLAQGYFAPRDCTGGSHLATVLQLSPFFSKDIRVTAGIFPALSLYILFLQVPGR